MVPKQKWNATQDHALRYNPGRRLFITEFTGKLASQDNLNNKHDWLIPKVFLTKWEYLEKTWNLQWDSLRGSVSFTSDPQCLVPSRSSIIILLIKTRSSLELFGIISFQIHINKIYLICFLEVCMYNSYKHIIREVYPFYYINLVTVIFYVNLLNHLYRSLPLEKNFIFLITYERLIVEMYMTSTKTSVNKMINKGRRFNTVLSNILKSSSNIKATQSSW